MADIIIHKVSEVYVKIICDGGIAYEMSEHFTFMIPNAKFHPKVKARVWDGKIRLLNLSSRLIYTGLVSKIEEWANNNEYSIEYSGNFGKKEFSVKEASEFIAKLNPTMTPHEHQMKAFIHSVRSQRGILVSPTSSGKSFIIYLLARYFNKKTLIVVPTTALVKQLSSDFADYGYEETTHQIMSGKEKNSDEMITVSTWQSIFRMPKEWFDQYEMVVVDETHLAKAKSFVDILSKLTNCKYRFGLTGTLDGIEVNELVLEGLLGSVHKVITTSELMDKKIVSTLKIKTIILKYPDEVRQLNKAMEYKDEIDFLVRNEHRNKFIKNLALSLTNNTLVLYQFVEKHGKPLYESILRSAEPGRKVFFISGDVDAEIREDVRRITEKETNAIIVASYGTFSTGTNIKNLNNVIFASPSKSKIRALQSIGRVLRLFEGKSHATLYDIADDMSWKSKQNHTLGHLYERLKIYASENFDYKIYRIDLGQ
jgi:superfamily II DNA or RNA helicase